MNAAILRDPRTSYYLNLLLCLALGAAFLWSSIPKIRYPFAFLASVYQYEMLGPASGAVLSIVLPWLELAVAVALIAGLLLEGAFLASIILTALFTFAQMSVLHRELSISCSCFSATAPEMISYRTLLRTALLLGAALLGLWTTYTFMRKQTTAT